MNKEHLQNILREHFYGKVDGYYKLLGMYQQYNLPVATMERLESRGWKFSKNKKGIVMCHSPKYGAIKLRVARKVGLLSSRG